jgi:transcription elongation factor Elf1
MTHDSFTCPHCGHVNALDTNAPVDIAKVACSQCGKFVGSYSDARAR